MKTIILPVLAQEEHDALQVLYQTTKDIRVRTRAQMVLLSVEQHYPAQQIAEIMRESQQTVLR